MKFLDRDITPSHGSGLGAIKPLLVSLGPGPLLECIIGASLKVSINSCQEFSLVRGLRTGCLEILLENRNYGLRWQQDLYGSGKDSG